MANFEKMDELEELEDGVYLCRFTYKYAIFLDMPKCGMDVHRDTWAKALWRMNPCLSKVWFGIDEFINAFVKTEAQCGDYGIATRKIACRWAEAVYGQKITQIYYRIHYAYEITVGKKEWCQMAWKNVEYNEVQTYVYELSSSVSWDWIVDRGRIIKKNYDNTESTIMQYTQRDTRRWDLLKMIDYGVPYVEKEG